MFFSSINPTLSSSIDPTFFSSIDPTLLQQWLRSVLHLLPFVNNDGNHIATLNFSLCRSTSRSGQDRIEIIQSTTFWSAEYQSLQNKTHQTMRKPSCTGEIMNGFFDIY